MLSVAYRPWKNLRPKNFYWTLQNIDAVVLSAFKVLLKQTVFIESVRTHYFYFSSDGFYSVCHFLRATAVPAGTAEARISYGNSVCPSVCLSVCHNPVVYQAQVETPGLHHMIA